MKKFKIGIFALFAVFLFSTGCDKWFGTEKDYQGIRVYKTRADYFNNITVGMKKEEDRIYRTSDAIEKVIYTKSDTIPKNRIRLVEGYVWSGEGYFEDDVFLSMTFKDQIKWQNKYGLITMPVDTARKYILDREPYIEYYEVKDNQMFFNKEDTVELNRIILESRLEEYFTKIK